MRIGVVSDTHCPRFERRLEAVLARLRAERVDAIMHCGDFTSIGVVPAFEAIAPFDGVAGNNDGSDIVARFGRRKILDIAGRRIGLVHGDAGPGGTTPECAWLQFSGENMDAILFGHSHVPFCERRAGVLLLNPGSPTDKRSMPVYSYAVLDLNPAELNARFVRF